MADGCSINLDFIIAIGDNVRDRNSNMADSGRRDGPRGFIADGSDRRGLQVRDRRDRRDRRNLRGTLARSNPSTTASGRAACRQNKVRCSPIYIWPDARLRDPALGWCGAAGRWFHQRIPRGTATIYSPARHGACASTLGRCSKRTSGASAEWQSGRVVEGRTSGRATRQAPALTAGKPRGSRAGHVHCYAELFQPTHAIRTISGDGIFTKVMRASPSPHRQPPLHAREVLKACP